MKKQFKYVKIAIDFENKKFSWIGGWNFRRIPWMKDQKRRSDWVLTEVSADLLEDSEPIPLIDDEEAVRTIVLKTIQRKGYIVLAASHNK